MASIADDTSAQTEKTRLAATTMTTADASFRRGTAGCHVIGLPDDVDECLVSLRSFPLVCRNGIIGTTCPFGDPKSSQTPSLELLQMRRSQLADRFDVDGNSRKWSASSAIVNPSAKLDSDDVSRSSTKALSPNGDPGEHPLQQAARVALR